MLSQLQLSGSAFTASAPSFRESRAAAGIRTQIPRAAWLVGPHGPGVLPLTLRRLNAPPGVEPGQKIPRCMLDIASSVAAVRLY